MPLFAVDDDDRMGGMGGSIMMNADHILSMPSRSAPLDLDLTSVDIHLFVSRPRRLDPGPDSSCKPPPPPARAPDIVVGANSSEFQI